MDPQQLILRDMPERFAGLVERLERRVHELDELAAGGDADAVTRRDKYRRRLEQARAARVAMEIEITGDDGGVFALQIADGRMQASAGHAEHPLVGMRQSIADLRATTEAGVGARFSLVGGPAEGETRGGSGFARLLSRQLLEQLESARTTLRFVIQDVPGHGDWSLDLGLGGLPAAEPTCTIRVTHTDYREIEEGRLAPQAAFFAGKLRVMGDLSPLMRLGPALLGG
jgi:hypothetical protein